MACFCDCLFIKVNVYVFTNIHLGLHDIQLWHTKTLVQTETFCSLSSSNKSETLPVSTTKNITCVGLSPDGNLAVLVDEGKSRYTDMELVSLNMMAFALFTRPRYWWLMGWEGAEVPISLQC